jgi:hypothetical protein
MPPWNHRSSVFVSYDTHFDTTHQSGANARPMIEAHCHTNSQDLISESYLGKRMFDPPVGSQPLPRWARGHYRYPMDRVPPRTCFKLRQRAKHAPTRCHMPPQLRNLPPCLVRAPVLPPVSGLRSPHLCLGGVCAASCPKSSDLAPLPMRGLTLPYISRLQTSHLRLGGVRRCYVSHGPSRVVGHRDKKGLAVTSCSKARVFSRYVLTLLRHM